MIIKAYGRRSIEHNSFKLLKEASMNHILISITGEEKYVVDLQHVKQCPFTKDILTLYFEDLDGESKDCADTHILFNDAHATAILRFVCKHVNNISAIIVHCDAGVSRSVGTAAALSKILNGKDDAYFKGCPNRLVYSSILSQCFESPEKYKELDKYYWAQRRLEGLDEDIF